MKVYPWTENEHHRQQWLRERLTSLTPGIRILDAGAGELKNARYCTHLDYVSQDFCQYKGADQGAVADGLQLVSWDTRRIDLVSDITHIPAPDKSFDAILCSEVLEHVPEPSHALDEFERLLKPGGVLILTAPFASLVHMAPYHYCSGFSRYWYEEHLTRRGFEVCELVPNGDWFSLLRQEVIRLGGEERRRGNWVWPLAYLLGFLTWGYGVLRRPRLYADLACYGWHCMAVKR